LGAAAVTIIIRRERDLVDHFRRAGATGPKTAQSPSSLGVDNRLAWHRLAERAVIREAATGTWYLDEPSWEALRRMRRRMGIAMLVVILMVAAASLITARR
jgi:hypothetical protein